MKYCDDNFGREIITSLNPFGEVAIDTNYDERMTMMLMCHVVREFFDRVMPHTDRDMMSNDGIKMLIGLSNTLGYRLEKATATKEPEPFTIMIGELTLMLMMMEKVEAANEIIHLAYGSNIPDALTSPLHEKIFDTLKKTLSGDCYVHVPETPEESLFTQTTLAMVPAQGGMC